VFGWTISEHDPEAVDPAARDPAARDPAARDPPVFGSAGDGLKLAENSKEKKANMG